MKTAAPELTNLLNEIRRCRLCEPELPFGARPVLQCSNTASILIAGQAPGIRVHESGIPFDDASGERLRAWMGIERDVFYDARRIAILPMGFCYPGTGKAGDLPPRPECAETWREALMQQLPRRQLTLMPGRHSQSWHCRLDGLLLTERVEGWRHYWPHMLPLPHPSPRNNRWLKQNPWFATSVLPQLQARVDKLLQQPDQQTYDD